MALPIAVVLVTMTVFGPKLRSRFGDRAVQARDDRADADHRAGADDHAQHREERAHLVRAHGIQRQPRFRDK